MSVKRRVLIAKVMLWGSLIAWPLTHVWVFLVNGFDPFEHLVLALSWWAITSTAWDVVQTADVHVTLDDKEER
jgi:hypothetical protein